MTVRVYKSTDASAPVLTGAVGSLTALLDAVLVNGYGSLTAAGWTIAFTATNKRSYLQASGHSGFYLDVNDAAPTIAKEAQMRGYETMSAVGTGTQAFPTSGQSSFGVVCRKSTTADATARPWYIVADGGTLYIFVDTGDFTSPPYSMGFYFGDFFSYKSGDPYNCAIIGRSAENPGFNFYSAEELNVLAQGYTTSLTAINAALAGHYVDRSWTGLGGSLPVGKISSYLAGVASGFTSPWVVMGASTSICTYPNGPDAALELAPIWISQQNSLRGYLKGLWCPLHYQPTGHADTFSGTGNMAGKSFLSLNMTAQGFQGSNAQFNGQIVVETSDTWS